jgi:guanylate kinase
VTCTTRPPRAGEQQGIDYNFLDLPSFDQRVAAGEFLEYAEVYGNRYGTLKSSVVSLLRSGSDVLLSVDVQGVAAIQECSRKDPEIGRSLVTAFLSPSTLTELEQRLRGRGTDSPAVVARRLATAAKEADQWWMFDYIVTSGTREQDQHRMQAILDAERIRTSRTTFALNP